MWTLFILIMVGGDFSHKLTIQTFEFSKENLCEVGKIKVEKLLSDPKNVSTICLQNK